jgi:ABC-type nickel/cobalt efflux system permease component RcnA
MRINFLYTGLLLLLVANNCLLSDIGDLFGRGFDRIKNKTNRLISKLSSREDGDHHHHHHNNKEHNHHHNHNGENRKNFNPLVNMFFFNIKILT